MITLANKTDFIKEYNCITADITANKHIPDAKGNLLGVKVKNETFYIIWRQVQPINTTKKTKHGKNNKSEVIRWI